MTVRRRLVLLAVAALEGWFFLRYWQFGALFHYWLHLLLGGALAFGLLALGRIAGCRRRADPVVAGLAGHLWSAFPDVLFLSAGILHVRWMDVFALHITAHFLWPNALLTALVLWSLAVLALLLAVLGRRVLSAFALVAAVGVLGAGLALRTPIPATLEQVRMLERDSGRVHAGQWARTSPPVQRRTAVPRSTTADGAVSTSTSSRGSAG